MVHSSGILCGKPPNKGPPFMQHTCITEPVHLNATDVGVDSHCCSLVHQHRSALGVGFGDSSSIPHSTALQHAEIRALLTAECSCYHTSDSLFPCMASWKQGNDASITNENRGFFSPNYTWQHLDIFAKLYRLYRGTTANKMFLCHNCAPKRFFTKKGKYRKNAGSIL